MIALLATFLGGCSGGSERPAGAFPIAHGEAHASGTQLPFGFRVPPDATLIGPLLPGDWASHGTGATVDGHETAFLAIEKTPEPVIRELFRQAHEKGFVGGLTCQSSKSSHGSVFCEGGFSKPQARRCIRVDLNYGITDQPLAALDLRFSTDGSNCLLLADDANHAKFEAASTPHFARAARAGDSIFAGLPFDLRVQPGSAVVGKPFADVMLLRIDTDAERVIKSYLAAASHIRYFGHVSALREVTRSAWRVRSWEADDPEGDRVLLDVLQRADHTYLIARESLDY